jgi:hypothetical protein
VAAEIAPESRAFPTMRYQRLLRFRSVAGAASVAAASLFARPAAADTGDWESNYDPGRAQRRSDFALGVTAAGMFGAAAGYPDDANKINIPAYEARTGATGGTAGGLWLGAALRDWFVFGIGTNFGTVAGADASLSRGAVFVLHVEAFPLFYKGGAFQDLGVFTEVGTGSRTILKGSQEVATSGSVSYGALGVVWEPVRAGKHVSLGPVLEISHQFSDRFWATYGILGVQVAYYGGPD